MSDNHALTCPNCTAPVDSVDDEGYAVCPYCGSKVFFAKEAERADQQERLLREAELKRAQLEKEIKEKEINVQQTSIKMMVPMLIVTAVILAVAFIGMYFLKKAGLM